MTQTKSYPIGSAGKKWGEPERAKWLSLQTIKRSYSQEVAGKIALLRGRFDVDQYGELDYGSETYPLYIVKSKSWDSGNRTVLFTGGVHGYETSGVQGALRFLETAASNYEQYCNIIVAPCISPWGYETINRWNPRAIDPNRSFYPDSPAPECEFFMRYLNNMNVEISLHMDLHETTDTDNSEFMPALAARDATEAEIWDIPDGFYLVGDTENPADDFQRAVIESVEKVTHIAPADSEGRIIGRPLSQRGVIHYQVGALGLCAALTGADYCTTTEVYPDSPSVDDENCINAQLAAVTGGLEYLLGKG